MKSTSFHLTAVPGSSALWLFSSEALRIFQRQQVVQREHRAVASRTLSRPTSVKL